MTVLGLLQRLSGMPARIVKISALAVLAVVSLATAQQGGQRITPNFKDADITQIAEAVSSATGKNFIIDPRVRAQVTMLSSTPMSPEAFYQTFLSILQVHGFVALPAGNVIKIMPDANARQFPANDLPDHISSTSDEIVTQVIAVKSVSAAQLVPILRPLIPQYGHLAAYPASNILIVSDRASNVNRIIRIIRRIDQEGDAEVEIVSLQNASAAEIVRVVTSLNQQQQGAEGTANPLKLVADERSNSVLISGDQSQRLRIRTLIAHLDTPLESGGDTQVRYLRYADAEKIAGKLKEQVTGVAQGQPQAAGGATPQAQAEKGTTIWADPETNSLIMTAPPKVMRSLMTIVDKLDIRRMQVLVEAIIVEVQADKSAELGVNWAVFDDSDDSRIPLAGFLSPVGGVNLIDLAGAVDSGVPPAGIRDGTTVGIGRIGGSGVNFGAMLRAIRSDANTNIISTPSTVTMDNQEAELKVAQEVPFVTGQYSSQNSGGDGNGNVNPFQTIQREEVGTILKVTPKINLGDSVMLKIELESSSLAAAVTGAADLVTNKRTITTNVLIEDGGIVVLGGLISDRSVQGEARVPFLGRIPIIGLAFKTRNGEANKTNLMVFIRPKILRDGVDTAIETNSKYNYIREEQRKAKIRELLPILPGVKQPLLPEAQPIPPRDPAPDPTSTEKSQEQSNNNAQSGGAAPKVVPAQPPGTRAQQSPRTIRPGTPQPAPDAQATPAPAPEGDAA